MTCTHKKTLVSDSRIRSSGVKKQVRTCVECGHKTTVLTKKKVIIEQTEQEGLPKEKGILLYLRNRKVNYAK